MSSSIISIFGNKIFLEILNEMKIFSKYKIKYYDEIDLCVKDAEKEQHLVVFFITESNKDFFKDIKKNNFPLIFVGESSILQKVPADRLNNQLNMPFTILDLKKKVIQLSLQTNLKRIP